MGMIKVLVRDVAERAGIQTAYALMKQGELDAKTAYAYWNGTVTRFDASVLERLCNLFNVPVGQLLQHIPDGKQDAMGSRAKRRRP
jgi:hypothetical protein